MTTRSSAAETIPDFVVSAFRYSDDPPATAKFLSVLGLDLRLRTGDTWFDLRGRTGAVTVHATGSANAGTDATGVTDLVLITPDARRAVTYLRSRRIQADAWDESFGVQADAPTPYGHRLPINEEPSDTYGSQSFEPTPGPIDVITVLFTDDHAAALSYFAHFGFEIDPGGTADWQVLRRAGSGAIGVHRRTGTDPSSADPVTGVGLGFETPEELTVVADRLRGAGYQPRLVDDSPARIEVVDPDGVRVEIRSRPDRSA